MTPEEQAPADLVNAPTPANGTRRTFLLGAASGMATLAIGRAAAAAEPTSTAAPAFAYIGCFTSETRKASAKGISVYRIGPAGDWTLAQTLETLPNPQFIAFDRQQRNLYSVHGDGTEVSSYAIDKASGRIRFLNKQPTNGKNSTHLTPDPSNRYIVIGNGPGRGGVPDQSGRVAGAVHRHGAGARRGRPAPQSDRVPARIRITFRSIPSAVSWSRPTAASTAFRSTGWMVRPASSPPMTRLSARPVPGPVRAISPFIHAGFSPMCATSSIRPSRRSVGIPSAAPSRQSR